MSAARRCARAAEEALKNTWLTSERVGAVPLVAAQSLLREFAVTNALPARLYRDGETLIRQGERAREVFVIRKGLVDVFIDARRGGLAGAVEEVHLGQARPPQNPPLFFAPTHTRSGSA